MKKYNKEMLISAYKKMLEIRKFEEKCSSIYTQKEIRGFCHLYIGQEAIATGVKSALKEGDAMITAYRCHGHALAAGEESKYVMAELMQKKTGISKGKGGSMHLFSLQNEFYGGHGIVGAQVSIGTGIAFSKKYQNTDNVCVTFMGDGAFNQGQVYESFNMASLWNLPALFILENNQYAMGTSTTRGCANSSELYKRAEPFGIKCKMIEGMNFFEVYEEIQEALKYVRQGKPMLIEIRTYRYKGHSMSDPATYRTKDELQKYKDLDPIVNMENYLLDKKIANKDELKEIQNDIKQLIKEAYEFSSQSPKPSLEDLYTEIL